MSASTWVYGSISFFCTFTLGMAAAGLCPTTPSASAALQIPLRVFTAKRRSVDDGHSMSWTILRSISELMSGIGTVANLGIQ
ncbi:hypothetical protein D9M70_648110 [compost metagenome]